ncbi:MAG: aminodeoxychorismate/anthranilate synthase component II [Firmicutes bacterium]|nr:aminodeoxychorismate/anthranilate synthase component II [Bacillota bacterium]
MIVLVDNYDSFTYNLAQYLCELGADVHVVRNDAATVEALEDMAPDALVVSPGPGRPEEAGISVEAIRRLGARVPVLGVCLGHQAIGVAYGARVTRGPRPVHGQASAVEHAGQGVFRGLPSPFPAARYHSLVVAEAGLPACLEVTARSLDGVVMGIRHRELPVEGVQFHPESVLTPHGKALLGNFLETVYGARAKAALAGTPAGEGRPGRLSGVPLIGGRATDAVTAALTETGGSGR